jgi:hypothetical protein
MAGTVGGGPDGRIHGRMNGWTQCSQPHRCLQTAVGGWEKHAHKDVHEAVDQHSQAREIDVVVHPRPGDDKHNRVMVPVKKDQVSLLQHKHNSVQKFVKLGNVKDEKPVVPVKSMQCKSAFV